MRSDYKQEKKWMDVLGHRVCYVDEGEGWPLFFVHGLAGSIFNWEPNLEYFKRCYRVLALDLPGCGQSDKPKLIYDDEFYSGVVMGFLEQLGIARATLIGSSLGGLICLKIALDHAEAVDSLVLVDTAGARKFPRPIRWLIDKLSDPLIKRVLLFISKKIATNRTIRWVVGIYQDNQYTRNVYLEAASLGERPDREAYLDANVSVIRNVVGLDYSARIGEIGAPTLIVWGEKDLGIKLKVAYELNRRLPGSFLVTVKDAAHVPQVEAPEVFNRALERFLEGTLSQAGPSERA